MAEAAAPEGADPEGAEPEGADPEGGPSRRGPWRRRPSRVHRQNEELLLFTSKVLIVVQISNANMITGPTERSMADGEWAREKPVNRSPQLTKRTLASDGNWRGRTGQLTGSKEACELQLQKCCLKKILYCIA